MKKAFVQEIIVNPIVNKTKKKLQPLAVRKKNALLGKGGYKGTRRVNEDHLNAEQEEFCQIYTSEGEFFGDGTNSYIEAYDIEVGRGEGRVTYESCRSSASRLLTNVNILKRIDELLSEEGFSEQYADKTLKFLMTQKANLNVTLGAVGEFNKLRGRIRDKIDHTHQVLGIVKMVYDEADRLAKGSKKSKTNG